MAELKPCPFCGENPELIMCKLESFEALQFGVSWIVICPGCHTKKISTSKYQIVLDESIIKIRDGKQAVIELWNRRAEDGN